MNEQPQFGCELALIIRNAINHLDSVPIESKDPS